MNPLIKKAYENGYLILFFGAGSSLTSKGGNGENLPSSESLSKKLADVVGWEYNGEPLSKVYSAAKRILGDRLNDQLIEIFKHCEPSEEYKKIANYVWPRIYTTNIDDALDSAFLLKSTQKVNIRHRFDKVVDQDQILNSIDLVKLNGSIDRIENGFIFSPNEYGQASAQQPLWYRELAEDFYRYTFIFIGTKLDEPLFYHQISRYKSENNSVERRSYVITPNATPIEESDLETLNLEHIAGTLADFVSWMEDTFTEKSSSLDIAYNRNPALKEALSKTTIEEQEKYVSIFDDVFIVDRKSLNKPADSKDRKKIRSFYKGFKPNWVDIFDEIPAYLESTKKLVSLVEEKIDLNSNLIVVNGPAGCGKTTLLKQVAYIINDLHDIPCYFLERPTTDFKLLIHELENLHNSKFCLFFDRLDAHALELNDLIKFKKLENCMIVGSESQRKWQSDLKDMLGEYCDGILNISLITKNDALAILEKIEIHGPWTRLARMSKKQRLSEVLERSKRQLLIGLLEATYGDGFEKIIEREFNEIEGKEEKAFVILIGLATIHRYGIRHEYVSRALTYLDIGHSIEYFINRLSGIINYENGVFVARHHVYVKHLFSEIIDGNEIYPILEALLSSYTVYESPILKNVGRNEMQLYKALTNHRFLKDIFRQNKSLILKTYENFEKEFENDGHFLLQYGLALRDFQCQPEAYEKIKTALSAFPTSSHIEHALAQQELILACDQNSKAKAYDLLTTAIERLEELNKHFRTRSAYPIVTLSEGHTNVMRKFEDDQTAKNIAKSYANRIASIGDFQQNFRLKSTWKVLTNFVSSGEWNEEKKWDS